MPVPVPVPAHSTFSTPTPTSAFLPGSSTPYTAPSSSSSFTMSTTTSPPNGIAPSSSLPYPALYLYPLNDSFVPKHIALNHGQHVKIGRQTNAKTAPGERNGYFDSKVLSRQHAEVWEDAGKIFIKDVKSSNGTFINGERLSSEAVESDPYELKSDDIVEFGIDIVGEDNKTIIHHKVAARVMCVFSEQDAAVAGRAEVHAREAQQAAQAHSYGGHQTPAGVSQGLPGQGMGGVNGSGAPSGFNFTSAAAGQRRPQMSQPSLGGLGGGMRPPGKGGLSFDVILSRLQGELQKSRETGAELSTLNGAMGEICDTLAGGLPSNLPPYPSALPAVRPPQEAPSPEIPAPVPRSQSPAASSFSNPAIGDLQAQIQETQSTLAAHIEKIRGLEVVLKEQEDMKREVRGLKEVLAHRTHANDRRHEGAGMRQGFDLEEEDEDVHDDDDVRSVATVMGHELERVEEEDEVVDMDVDGEDDHSEGGSEGSSSSALRIAVSEEEREREEEEYERREAEAEDAAREEMERRDAERPGTPEPVLPSALAKRAVSPLSQSTSVRENSTIGERGMSIKETERLSAKEKETEAMREQLSALTAQVSAVVALTSTLEAQHAAAQDTIRGLEGKVEQLEGLLRVQIQQQQAAPVVEKESTPQPAPPPVEEKESLTDRITDWMKNVEGKWNTVQEEWNQERERLGRAREEWESKVRLVDSNLQKLANATASTSAGGYGAGGRTGGVYVNGDVVKHNGLVTPPSPRSQSSDSGRYRRRRRRNREGRRGSGGETESDEEAEGRSESESEERKEVGVVERVVESRESTAPTSAASSLGVVTGNIVKEKGLPTPDASVYKAAALSAADSETLVDSDVGAPVAKAPTAHERNMINLQTAAGVLLLSVAAAAVIWKVKPE